MSTPPIVVWTPFSFRAIVRIATALACSCNPLFWKDRRALKLIWCAAWRAESPDFSTLDTTESEKV